jgi:hypothetical protein
MIRLKRYCLLMCALALIPPMSSARNRALTKDEAQKLVVAAIGRQVKDLPHFGFDDILSTRPQEKDFYIFEASYSNPGGMQIIGHYAVHKFTGAVWEFVVCRKMESEELHRLQLTFLRRIGVSANEAKQLADVSPCD